MVFEDRNKNGKYMPEEKEKKGEGWGVKEVEKKGREGGGRNWEVGRKLMNKWTNQLINDCVDKLMNRGKEENIEREGGWVGGGGEKCYTQSEG